MFHWNSANSTLCLSLQRAHLFWGEAAAGRRCGLLGRAQVVAAGFDRGMGTPRLRAAGRVTVGPLPRPSLGLTGVKFVFRLKGNLPRCPLSLYISWYFKRQQEPYVTGGSPLTGSQDRGALAKLNLGQRKSPCLRVLRVPLHSQARPSFPTGFSSGSSFLISAPCLWTRTSPQTQSLFPPFTTAVGS